MSYTHQEAKHEQDEAIFNALDTRDSEACYQLAEQLKEQGEDENAEDLLKNARRFDDEDGAYDQANAN